MIHHDWTDNPCEISSNNCDRLIKNKEAWPAWNDWIKFTWIKPPEKLGYSGTRTHGNSQRCSWTCQEIPQRMEKDHHFSRGKHIISSSFPGCALICLVVGWGLGCSWLPEKCCTSNGIGGSTNNNKHILGAFPLQVQRDQFHHVS